MAGKELFINRSLKFFAIFILCGWMFFLGVLVGRGTSPVSFDTRSFQKKLAAIAGGDKKEHKAEKKSEKKMDFDFYEMLQKPAVTGNGKLHKTDEILPADSDTQELQNRKLEKQKKDAISTIKMKKSRKAMTFSLPVNKSNASSESKSNISSESKSNIQPAKKFDALPAKKSDALPENKSDSLLKKKSDSSIVVYTIQIAAYRNLNDALKLMESLKAKGYKPYRTMGRTGNKIWHRVRVGSFSDMAGAKETEKKLESVSIKGIIIQKNR